MRGCGSRIGEALAVGESSIRDHVLRVSDQMHDRRPRVGPLKHRKPGEYRDVPLPRYVLTRIEEHVKQHGTVDGYLFRGRSQALPSQHTVRANFASVANGVPITDVSRWLGHRSVDTTFKIYNHFVPDAFESGRDVLDAEFEELS